MVSFTVPTLLAPTTRQPCFILDAATSGRCARRAALRSQPVREKAPMSSQLPICYDLVTGDERAIGRRTDVAHIGDSDIARRIARGQGSSSGIVPSFASSVRRLTVAAGRTHRPRPLTCGVPKPRLPTAAMASGGPGIRARADRLDICDRRGRASTVPAAPSGVTVAVTRVSACGSLADAAARSADPGEPEIRPDTCPRPDHHANSGARPAEYVCALTGASVFRCRGSRSRGGRSSQRPRPR